MQDRLRALVGLLEQGAQSTQEELVAELKRREFQVTQSTISRDLRKIGAVKTLDNSGRTVYRLAGEVILPSVPSAGLRNQVLDIEHNGSLIVIHTVPGSASLIARFIDARRDQGFLGTIAGDDTVFIAPRAKINLEKLVQWLSSEFLG